MTTPKRPAGWMLLAQGICAAAIPVTAILALLPLANTLSYIGYADFEPHDNTLLVALGLSALRSLLLGGCLAFVEAAAFGICGRIRHSSAFSAKNEKALGRISLALCAAGCVTLLLGDDVMPWLLTGLPALHPIAERLLLPFILLTLALMLRAVQVLMRRALTMQEESDLTV